MKERMFNFGGDMAFGGFNGGASFGNFGESNQPKEMPDDLADERLEEAAGAKRAHRRTKECTELSQRYEYRRAFSEVRMLEAMEYVKLQDGHTYNFITAGDVDSLTYLKVVLNQHNLDYLLMSTWCMAAEDILQVQQWHEAGRYAGLICIWARFFRAAIKSNGRWSRSSTKNTRRWDGPQYSGTTAKFMQVATKPIIFISASKPAQT